MIQDNNDGKVTRNDDVSPKWFNEFPRSLDLLVFFIDESTLVYLPLLNPSNSVIHHNYKIETVPIIKLLVKLPVHQPPFTKTHSVPMHSFTTHESATSCKLQLNSTHP